VDPDVYFCEDCVVMAYGYVENGIFKIQKMMQPPLHYRKQFTYRVNENDYFGSYTKLQSIIAAE
jgi:hypothetical protein